MRIKNSIRNITVSLALGFAVIIINFVAQKIFIDTLGIEYAGLNGLFTNMVSMLAIAELGLGAAIVYHLYKPLHEKDEQKVSSIMHFYKVGYRLVAFAILGFGGLLIPFLPMIIGDSRVSVNIAVVYMLFIVNAAASYLLSYKRSLLYADQKNYIVNTVHLVALVVLNVLQVWALIATQNYYLYLVLKIVSTVVENLVISYVVDKRYVLDGHPEPMNKELRADIFTKMKGLVFHKVGDFAVLGSNSIIISSSLGLTAVGLYSNYLLIQMAITTLFSQISTALKASVGNLLVDVGGKKSFVVFSRLQFANQVLAVLATSLFFVVSGSFVALWLGDNYVFETGVVAALALNIYLMLIRSVFGNFKDAAGIFYEDRYVPLVESAINIVASIILIQFMGIAGAFIGTALSSLALHAYTFPKYVYKGVFGRTYLEYATHMTKNTIVAVFVVGAAYFASIALQPDVAWWRLVSDVLIATAVPTLLLWLIYRRTDEYVYFKDLISKILKRKKRSK